MPAPAPKASAPPLPPARTFTERPPEPAPQVQPPPPPSGPSLAPFCNQCGTGFTEDSLFCRRCGARRRQLEALDPSEGTATGSGHTAESSEYVLAKGPDGKHVWIHKATGMIRTSLPSADGTGHENDAPNYAEEKDQKKKTILDNVVGALQAAADQSLRSAAVAPPVTKAPMVAKPPSALPPRLDLFLPAAATHIQPNEESAGSQDLRRSRSRKRSRSKRRKKSRSRSKPARKRGGMGFSNCAPDYSVLPTGIAPGYSNNKLLGRKVLHMPEQHIRCLLGHGGLTIQSILRKSCAAIKVEHTAGNPSGIVTIGNNIDKAMTMIFEALTVGGCDPARVVDETREDAGGFGRV